MIGTKSSVFRFDDVEVREREFSIVKAGETSQVEPKAFRVLLFLLHNPQKLITKEELLNAVWGETAVSENSLTRSIALLRRLLGDDTHVPRYIETVATVGYRFVCPVVNEESSGSSQVAEEVPISGATQELPRLPTETMPRSWLRRWRWILITGTSFVALGVAILFWYASRPLPAPHITEIARITNDPRYNFYFISGTDGSRIYLNALGLSGVSTAAFGQVPVSGGNITALPINIPSSQPLSSYFLGPLSPDDSSFLLMGPGGPDLSDMWVVGTSGGASRFLTKGKLVWTPAWSPDGSQVVYPTLDAKIYTIPSAGGEPHLIRSLAGSDVPFRFVYSPDGTKIRFNWGDYRLMEMSPDGSNLHEILAGWHPKEMRCCGIWTADGSFYLFFAPGASETPEVLCCPDDQIWAVDERRGGLRKPDVEPVQLTFGPMTWTAGATPSPDPRKIFATGETRRGEIVRFNRQTKALEPFLGGISAEWVDFSRDGKYVLYAPFPGGTLMRASRDGTGVQQVISARNHPMVPRWSPDGNEIALVYGAVNQPSSIYLVSSQGGTPVRVFPDDKEDEDEPTWSPDGKQLLYWSRSAEGKTETELRIVDLATHQISYLPRPPKRTYGPEWSPDGRYIVCHAISATNDDGIQIYDFKTQSWRILLTEPIQWPRWSSDSRWIYYLIGLAQADRVTIYRVSVEGGRPELIADLPGFRSTGWLLSWFGLDPDDNPLLLRDEGTEEVYALTLGRK